MTIYTRFGSEVKVIANCGQCQPKDFKTPVTLLGVLYPKEKKLNYYFMEFLKATNGWQEIQQAVGDVPNLTLTPEEFNEAIKEAM